MVAGPAISGMPSGTTPKSSGRLLLLSWEDDWTSSPSGQDEEDQPARDLEIALADADRNKDAPPEEEEEEGDDAPGPGRLVGDVLSLGDGYVPAQRQENRGQPHRVYRHEQGDEAL